MTAWVKKHFSDRESAQSTVLSVAAGFGVAGVAMMVVGVLLAG